MVVDEELLVYGCRVPLAVEVYSRTLKKSRDVSCTFTNNKNRFIKQKKPPSMKVLGTKESKLTSITHGVDKGSHWGRCNICSCVRWCWPNIGP